MISPHITFQPLMPSSAMGPRRGGTARKNRRHGQEKQAARPGKRSRRHGQESMARPHKAGYGLNHSAVPRETT